MTSTINAECDCGCGEIVTATLGGFTATTAELAACSAARRVGMVSRTIRISAVRQVTAPMVQHAEGLVVFG